jgi:hypothetical protein
MTVRPITNDNAALTPQQHLEQLIGNALADYLRRPADLPHVMPSEFIADELVRQVPGLLDAIGGGR